MSVDRLSIAKHIAVDSGPSTPGPLSAEVPEPLLINTSAPLALVPFSQRLRIATTQAHQDVMMPAMVTQLVKGELPRSVHLRYLMVLHGIYTALEDALDRLSTHQHLSQVYNPALLARAPSLHADCTWFAAGESDWLANTREGQELSKDQPQAVLDYQSRLQQLALDGERGGEDDSNLLLAHAYVRYLGDLSGGQSIARSLRKAYNLPDTGEGSSFYEFLISPGSPFSMDAEGLNSLPHRASLAETKLIKKWFREGLDTAGAQMSELQRLKVLEEAKAAFMLNMRVFQSFDNFIQNRQQEQGEPGSDSKGTSFGTQRHTISDSQSCAWQLALLMLGFIVVFYWTGIREFVVSSVGL